MNTLQLRVSFYSLEPWPLTYFTLLVVIFCREILADHQLRQGVVQYSDPQEQRLRRLRRVRAVLQVCSTFCGPNKLIPTVLVTTRTDILEINSHHRMNTSPSLRMC